MNAISTSPIDLIQESFDDQVNSDEEHHHRNLTSGYVNRVENGISRAFREEERRRNAPLTAENAMRVREAMRGVAFAGLTPDWANQIPEDRWIDQLRRLRQPQRPSSTV
ncbi:hypothetical protein GOBAR_AA30169 [Gossypium barbadense]|uniref:Uncharacterized protein n=1 Tax=Gossypium barbadense TaxID=3634 RepID=A0A2P5WHF4_GOSBA|nr:hypothetical protein GOBAR_AA30169 [Gossypium barbadense]